MQHHRPQVERRRKQHHSERQNVTTQEGTTTPHQTRTEMQRQPKQLRHKGMREENRTTLFQLSSLLCTRIWSSLTEFVFVTLFNFSSQKGNGSTQNKEEKAAPPTRRRENRQHPKRRRAERAAPPTRRKQHHFAFEHLVCLCRVFGCAHHFVTVSKRFFRVRQCVCVLGDSMSLLFWVRFIILPSCGCVEYLRSFLVFLSLPPLFECCLFCHVFCGWCCFPLLLFGRVASLHFLAVALPFSVVSFGIELKQCLSEIKVEFLCGGALFRCFPYLCCVFLLLLLLGGVVPPFLLWVPSSASRIKKNTFQKVR